MFNMEDIKMVLLTLFGWEPATPKPELPSRMALIFEVIGHLMGYWGMVLTSVLISVGIVIYYRKTIQDAYETNSTFAVVRSLRGSIAPSVRTSTAQRHSLIEALSFRPMATSRLPVPAPARPNVSTEPRYPLAEALRFRSRLPVPTSARPDTSTEPMALRRSERLATQRSRQMNDNLGGDRMVNRTI